SPIWVSDRLQAARAAWRAEKTVKAAPVADVAGVKEAFSYDAKGLWSGTVKPATDADNWFMSGSAAYWQQLKNLPATPAKAFEAQAATLADLATRHLWLEAREGATAPALTTTAYDRYGAYQIPRIRGVFAFHQLRLQLGNAAFAKAMQAVQGAFGGRSAATADLLKILSASAGKDVAPLLLPWIQRADLPAPRFKATVRKDGEAYSVDVEVTQTGQPWPFVAFASVETEKGVRLERLAVAGAKASFSFRSETRPTRVVFNAGNDVPLARANFWVPGNLLDDWDRALLVHGTTQEVEAQRTLALQYRELLADNMTEVLLPVCTDGDTLGLDLASRDVVVFGGPADNGLAARLQAEGKLPVEVGSGWFKWQGKTYGRADDGLLAAFPNPWNPKRMLLLILANSRTQQWAMTKAIPRGLPGWTLYRGSDVQQKGHAQTAGLTVDLVP
ncbi:MAG: hypothetical protein WCL47_09585, partial [Holophagaceae bacterium]